MVMYDERTVWQGVVISNYSYGKLIVYLQVHFPQRHTNLFPVPPFIYGCSRRMGSLLSLLLTKPHFLLLGAINPAAAASPSSCSFIVIQYHLCHYEVKGATLIKPLYLFVCCYMHEWCESE